MLYKGTVVVLLAIAAGSLFLIASVNLIDWAGRESRAIADLRRARYAARACSNAEGATDDR